MNTKFVSIIMAIGLSLNIATPVLAKPSSKNTQSNIQNIEEDKRSLKEIKRKKESLELNIEKMDNHIEKILKNIDDNNKRICQTKNDIKISEENIKKIEKDIEKDHELFNKRIRAMYVHGFESYFDIILESHSIGDLISRVQTIKKIIETDKKNTSYLNTQKQNIKNKKELFSKDQNKLLTLKSHNEKKLSDLNAKKQLQEDLIKELNTHQCTYASEISVSNPYTEIAISEIQNIKNTVPQSVPSRGASNIYSNSIVAYASNYIGTPYKWGGNGPNNFDCSGFVKYVYNHFGVNLPRTSSQQQCVGSAVSKENLKAGDLVFFGSPAYHVGIYVGNNCYIHAPRTGDFVKVSPLTRSDFSGGRSIK
ncbi:NlpC/P60 family protein [Clostridium rectalis]|uniref:C40 family peptidase n=1 Tax=Clostridium rectalis TaxID=2040295 RepID=UPI000F6344A9|nr:C40 family peptidase [Clostridium rectalis]